jgi:hypothetical protein
MTSERLCVVLHLPTASTFTFIEIVFIVYPSQHHAISTISRTMLFVSPLLSSAHLCSFICHSPVLYLFFFFLFTSPSLVPSLPPSPLLSPFLHPSLPFLPPLVIAESSRPVRSLRSYRAVLPDGSVSLPGRFGHILTRNSSSLLRHYHTDVEGK